MIFTYYCIFALTTSISTLLWYFLPALTRVRKEGIQNSVTQFPVLACTVYFVITFVMAPFVVSTMIFPSHGERFSEGLYRSMRSPDE